MSKRVNDAEAAAVDPGDDDGDTGSWLGAIADMGEREREARADRISRWAAAAGPPHAELMLGDDPEYTDRIGFWRSAGGVIRIRASRRGEFDPAERTEITDAEVKAIASAGVRPCPIPPADKNDERSPTTVFMAAVRQAIVAGIAATELADKFKVSTSTIGRWQSGRSVPVPHVRQVVSERLAAMISRRAECNAANPCCDRADEYNGYASGPLTFTCPKHCPCHD